MNWKDRKDDWKKNVAEPHKCRKREREVKVGMGIGKGECCPRKSIREWKREDGCTAVREGKGTEKEDGSVPVNV